MFEEHTFFKGPTGGVYGVSPRVINSGFVPPEGHTPASQEEKDSFLQKLADSLTLPRPSSQDDLQILALDLKEKGGLPEAIKNLTGVDVDELKKADIKRIKALKAEREAQKENVTIKEETIEPVEQPAKVPLTPAQRRRELHRERRQAKAKEFERHELETNILYGELSEDELILMETLQFQGFNMDQIRNILVAKRAKKEE